jgi:hypothetical protein
MDVLNEIVDEIEEEQARGIVPGYRVLRSMLNQPSLLTINSLNATNLTTSGNGFNTFSVALPRVIFNVNSIQLVNANIPQCTPNVPDRACVFWYYRLSEYSGKVPNPQNLYFVRLLPSYYKQENITNPTKYGYNRTFVSYPDIATQLALACASDLSRDNQIKLGIYQDGTYELNFIPNDISITYNSSINLFQMTGSAATYQLGYKYYASGTTYNLNDVVVSGGQTYRSIQGSNTGHTPSTNPLWWVLVYVDVVAIYSATTPYFVGRYVSYNNQLYKCIANTLGNLPTNATYWTLQSDLAINYRYLVAGYGDPNVALAQGTGSVQWNPYALFENGVLVQYNGKNYQALYQNQNSTPFPTSFSYVWNTTKKFSIGDVVLYSGTYYIATAISVNQTPSVFSSYWSQQAWSQYTSGIAPPPVYGLNAISQATDMQDSSFDYGTLCPFPEGIPGQPYDPTPQRILNSILGFVWNGVMTPSVLGGVIQQQDYLNFVSTATSLLYNRLRPIPAYITSRSSGLGAGATSLVSQTYTADGYANLNFTSIVSVYTTIAMGSTMDTQQNTNLLATCPMNCVNLGVSFFEPKIANEIMLRGMEMDTISITMLDEFGDPYIVTNNGVVSITLRLTYKDRIEIK